MNLTNLSLEDLKALVRAREIMDRQAGAVVPTEAPAAHRAPKRAPRARRTSLEMSENPDKKPTDWRKVIKSCPKCEKSGPVEPMFGTKPIRGVIYPQSWCKHCRATANYPRKPRVNHTKHTR